MRIDGAKQVVVVLALTLWAGSVSFGKYSGGTGEPNDPYRIATANDLNDIGNHAEDWGSHLVLVNDINLADYNGTQFNIIGNGSPYFTGVFDGNDHVISNFTYEANDTSDVGLFSYVDGNGLIKDLTLLDPNVAVPGESYSVGTLVGVLDGTVAGCTVVDAVVSGYYYVGGLVGCASLPFDPLHGSILNSGFSGAVSGDYCVGGLAGVAGSVVHGYSRGTVSGDSFVGGLIGEVYGKQILWNSSAATVTGRLIVGGLVGANGPLYGRIIGCYATGSVEGEDRIGGLVGQNHNHVGDSYATDSVSGDRKVGGLVGYNSGDVLNCFASGVVDANTNVGGLVGYDDSSSYTKSFWDSDVNPDV
ncbi:MAG: GLUG motif-containing protein, partial [Planctomycetota bacterium]